jgi:hypothetical protein
MICIAARYGLDACLQTPKLPSHMGKSLHRLANKHLLYKEYNCYDPSNYMTSSYNRNGSVYALWQILTDICILVIIWLPLLP